MSAKHKKPEPVQIRNNKAHHKYTVEETFEAGIILKGTEIKSIRAGKAQIAEAFVRIVRGKPILYNAYVDEYAFGNINNHNPTRPRELLLHKKETRNLEIASQAGGYAIIPLKLYFKGALAKLQIALCKGKKLHDKRQADKAKTDKREAERYLRGQMR